MAATQIVNRRINDRKLYLLAAILLPIIVVIGFARTYYLKGFFTTPPIPSRLVHLHGLIMTSWVLLFVTQVTLVATKRAKVHIRLGILGPSSRSWFLLLAYSRRCLQPHGERPLTQQRFSS